MRPMTVVSVPTGPPDAVVGVDFGGPDGYKKLSCAGLPYAPQVGDTVLVDYNGDQPFVVRHTTPGRMWVPPSLALRISNSGPSDPDAAPTSSISVRDGVIYAVRATPMIPPTVTRVVARPVAARTWDPVNGWDGANTDLQPRQGSWGGGICKGLWFYNPADLAQLAGLSGWTGRMQVRRANRGGNPSGPIQLQVWHHPHATRPGGEPTVLGQTAPAGAKPGRTDLVDFPLAASTVAAFVAGTAKGAAIASDVAAAYLIALGPADDADSGVLTFTRSS